MHRVVRLAALCLALATASTADAAGFARVGSYGFQSEGIFISARMSALGSADLADGGPAAVLLNPAPLAQEDGVAIGYDHADYIDPMSFRTWSGAVRWHGLSLNLANQDFVVDSQIIRSAYNPEGTGETLDARDRMTLAGLSAEPLRLRLGDGVLRAAAGAAWRHYDTMIDSSRAADGLDLGATLGWRLDLDGTWLGLAAAVAWGNVTDEKLTVDGREAGLPRPRRVGVTAEAGLRQAGDGHDLARLLLAYTHETELGDLVRGDCDRRGAELLLLETFAFRLGGSSRVSGGIDSWGAGVVLDRWLPDRFSLAADLGAMDYDNPVLGGNRTIWGVQAGYRF